MESLFEPIVKPGHMARVGTFLGSEVGHVGIEAALTGGTTMLGVNHLQIARSITAPAPQVVQHPLAQAMTKTTPSALWARAPAVVARPPFHQGLGEVFGTRDSFSDIGEIRPWSHAPPSMTPESAWKAERKRETRSTLTQL